jgi:hypothetical protein
LVACMTDKPPVTGVWSRTVTSGERLGGDGSRVRCGLVKEIVAGSVSRAGPVEESGGQPRGCVFERGARGWVAPDDSQAWAACVAPSSVIGSASGDRLSARFREVRTAREGSPVWVGSRA